MPRYNTSLASASISGSTTIGSPYSGAFTELTGTAPYTVTLPSPALYPGSNQTFYNASSGTITLTTPSGIFTGTGGSGANTVNCFMGNVVSVTSDGTNYVVISEDGSALVATTGTFSGDVSLSGAGATVSISPNVVTMSPTGSGNINNMSIGVTTRSTGAFTTLAANGQTSLTANIASTNTASGTLVVTGGIGASGTINASALSASSITGTLQTAAQPNITSVGTLTSLSVTASSTTKIGIGDSTSAVTTQGDYSNPFIIERSSNNGKGAVIMRGSDTIGTAIEHGRSNVSSHWGTYLSFLVHDDNTSDALTSVKEKVRVNATGLGVGTTPAVPLDVSGNARISGNLMRPDNAGIVATFGNGTNTLYGGTHLLQNAAGNTNLLTVNSTGLGVGVSPSYKLQVPGRSWISDGSSADTQTRAAGLTVTVNPGAVYSPGTDPGDTARTLSIISGGSSNYPAILGFRNITGGTNQQMVDLVMDPNNNKFHVSRPGYTPWLSISNTTHDINTSRGFRNWTKSHSAVNTSAGSGSPTSTNIVQVGDNMYEYGFYFFASTGGYPTCPYSYWVLCPVQKQNTGTLGWAEVTIRGVHRGMWGANGYQEYATIVVGTGSDGGGIWVKEWLNGDANNSSNRIRVGWMNYDGVYNEGTNYNTGWNMASINGNSIGQSYYKMPLFLKIYTNCGADKEYHVTVRTTDPGVLGPPFNGPMWLAPNVAPTSSIYW